MTLPILRYGREVSNRHMTTGSIAPPTIVLAVDKPDMFASLALSEVLVIVLLSILAFLRRGNKHHYTLVCKITRMLVVDFWYHVSLLAPVRSLALSRLPGGAGYCSFGYTAIEPREIVPKYA